MLFFQHENFSPPTFSFSLSFSSCIFQICGHDNTDTETISAFRFRLDWLVSCLCFTRHGWLWDFPSKITSSCIWVAIPVNWVIYIGMPVVRTDARSSGRAGVKGHKITKISGMGRWPDFLTVMLLCARFALLRAPLVIIHEITLTVNM